VNLGASKVICELYAKLRATRLLKDFSELELQQFLWAGAVIEVEEGEILLQEGADSDCLIILLEGTAEVIKGDRENNPHHIVTMGDGAVLGELGLLLNIPRTTSVITKAKSRVFLLKKDAFERILKEDSSTALKLCLPIATTIADRLQSLTKDVVELLIENDALLEIIDRMQNRTNTTMEEALQKKAAALKKSQNNLKRKLFIEIDEEKKAKQVAEITKSAYFQKLRQKIKTIKNKN
jgi:CRP-like cAMP-binding protein